jgi:hypothetical protein
MDSFVLDIIRFFIVMALFLAFPFVCECASLSTPLTTSFLSVICKLVTTILESFDERNFWSPNEKKLC